MLKIEFICILKVKLKKGNKEEQISRDDTIRKGISKYEV